MDVLASGREVDERVRFAPAADDLPVAPEAPPADLPVPRSEPPLPASRHRQWLIARGQTLFRPASRQATTKACIDALSLEIDRGVPFLFVPVFLAAGAMVYFSLAAEPSAFVLIAACIVTVGAFLALRHRPVAGFVAAVPALVVGGMLLAGVETWRAGTKMLGGEIATTVTGRVEAIERMASGRTRLTIAVLSTRQPALRYAPDRIRASARTIPAGLRPGSIVSGLAKLQPPSGPVRPGSYDFAFESYFDRIGATGFFLRGPELVPGADDRSALARFSTWIEDARTRIAGRIATRIGGPEGEIAAALMVGVRAGIPNDVNEALRRSGLYHIISISGLHMALVAGVVMGALRAGFALFPGLSSRRPVKKLAAALAIAAIAAYLFISGGEVAAERSFIMLAVMLAAVMVDRAALTMRNLALSALVVVVVAPHEVMGPSFQMSFAATAALVGAYGAWSNRKRADDGSAPPGRSLPAIVTRRVALIAIALAATSLIAGLATAPFGIYHFQRISPLGLAANLAVMPVVSLLVVPAAVLAAITMPFGLDGLFLDAMGRGLSMLIAVAEWFSARTPVDAVGLISGRSVILLTIALVVATMATTWLRAGALLFALPALVMIADVRAPDILVAEDGRLVGVATGHASLALNRPRASDFTLENWKRALQADRIVKPVAAGQDSGGKVRKNSGFEIEQDSGGKIGQGAFVCSADRCTTRHASGAFILSTADVEVARNACRMAAVIVLDDATAKLACANKDVVVLTSRDFALSGSAAIYLPGPNEAAGPEVSFAVDGTDRPWHRHRAFSRAARGLAPYRAKAAPNAPTPANSTSKLNAHPRVEPASAKAPDVVIGPAQ